MVRDIRAGKLTEPEVAVARAALRPGDVAIDVGANYGMYTIPMSRAVGASGCVYAFEPIPFTVGTLRTVCRVLGARNADIRAKACGEQPGSAMFSVPVQRSGAISAGQAHAVNRKDHRPGHEQHVRWDTAREVSCEVVALDQELRGVEGVALVKADIEGMELLAFRGARQIIERDLPVVISEINPWFLDGFELELRELTGFFTSLGYGMYRCDEALRYLRPLAPSEEVVEDNYVFLHPRRAGRLAELFA